MSLYDNIFEVTKYNPYISNTKIALSFWIINGISYVLSILERDDV